MDCTYLPLQYDMLHLTCFPSNLLLQLPLAPSSSLSECPLQGEGSGCAWRPLFERVIEPRLQFTDSVKLSPTNWPLLRALPLLFASLSPIWRLSTATTSCTPSQSSLFARAPMLEPPAGPEAYLQRMELGTVGNHPLKAVWEDNLALQIHDILESKGVK